MNYNKKLRIIFSLMVPVITSIVSLITSFSPNADKIIFPEDIIVFALLNIFAFMITYTCLSLIDYGKGKKYE